MSCVLYSFLRSPKYRKHTAFSPVKATKFPFRQSFSSFKMDKEAENNNTRVENTNIITENIINELNKTPLDETENIQPPLKRQKVNNNNDSLFEEYKSGIEYERAVGITFYNTTTPILFGEMKKRFEDFIVNEVNLEGKVVNITDQTIPSEVNEEEEVMDDEKILNELQQLLGPDTSSSLWDFLKQTKNEDKKTSQFLLEKDDDKVHRAAVHNLLKKIKGIFSETIDNKIVIKFSNFTRKDKSARDRRNLNHSKKSQSQFLHFTLLKKNRDTNQCFSDLSRMMRCKSSIFSYAGTKDKRGVTVQRCSAFRINPSQLLNTSKKLNYLQLGNFQFEKAKISLGELFGNRFSLVIRGVKKINIDEEIEENNKEENNNNNNNNNKEDSLENIIQKSFEEIKEKGFVNYFGLQRFGTGKIRTHQIGISILKNDWKEAVQLILSPINRQENADALLTYQNTGNIEETLMKIPRGKMSLERMILERLKYSGNDFCNAISSLPRNMRMMYVHSLQSFIWNFVTSLRLKKYSSLLPVVGDLVLVSDINDISSSSFSIEEDEIKEEEEVNNNNENDTKEYKEQKVKELCEDDIKSGNYSIFDVVLPLPGNNVVYPSFLQKDYLLFLEEINLRPSDFEQKLKEYNLEGGYRKIVERPIDLQWKIMKYNDENIPICYSESDLSAAKKEVESVIDGKHTAIVTSFTLNRSTYATMLVREILKFPTHYSSN